MGLITSSELPGHTNLRARICNALDRCQEFRDIDFKESGPWNELRWKIIRTVIAMGNLRGGGIIILGVSQRDDTWKLEGASQLCSKQKYSGSELKRLDRLKEISALPQGDPRWMLTHSSKFKFTLVRLPPYCTTKPHQSN